MKLTLTQTWIGSLLFLSILCAGCQPDQPDQSDKADSQVTSATDETRQIEVQVSDAQGFELLLEKQRGKVVVVDFWATWCAPCVAMFAHTVELANNFDPEDVAVVAVSMDDPDDEQRVREFLEKHEARFANLISSYGVGSAGFEAFEIPNGSIPHFRVYDQSGELVFSASTNEALETKILELLK